MVFIRIGNIGKAARWKEISEFSFGNIVFKDPGCPCGNAHIVDQREAMVNG